MKTLVRGCAFPHDRYYHVAHNVWVQERERGLFALGATSFGVALAGEFVSFRPKPIGTQVEVDRSVGLIELWKTLVSVRSPLSGTIAATNEAVAADPSLINLDPYGEGWLVLLEAVDREIALAGLVAGESIGTAFEAAMQLENFEGLPKAS